MSLNEDVFYSRLNDFGEYKYKNRLDTLFVLQLTFIVILIFIGLYYLSIFGLFSKISMYIVTMLLTAVLTLIIINKAIVMPKLRSKQSYDTYDFGNNTKTPTVPFKADAGVVGGNSGTLPITVCETRNVCTPV